MTTEKMTDRVRKLFAKAESTTSPHEAEALLARAYDLLAKYGIEEAVARAGAGTDASAIDTWDFTATGSYRYDQVILVNEVSAALHCSAIRVSKETLRVYGARRHLDRVQMLAGLLVTYMLATAGKATSPDPWVATVTYRKSVMLGFIATVAQRLREAEETAQEESSDSAGAEVVLASDARRAEQAMRDAHRRARNGSGPRRSAAGYDQGAAAAAGLDLGGDRRVTGTRALT